jgi:hypothetical protein
MADSLNHLLLFPNNRHKNAFREEHSFAFLMLPTSTMAKKEAAKKATKAKAAPALEKPEAEEQNPKPRTLPPLPNLMTSKSNSFCRTLNPRTFPNLTSAF